MRTRIHRIAAASPDDTDGLNKAIQEGNINAAHVIAVLGKTEGNGCVNDFTRAFSTQTLTRLFADELGCSTAEVTERIAFVMSGGTEGGLCPHWLVFEVDETPDSEASDLPGLAAGIAFTRNFAPEELGRTEQIKETAKAVNAAMKRAGIASVEDVHYVQIKCPLLTAARVSDACKRGKTVVTSDTYRSMGYSRGASALGVALALNEVNLTQLSDESVCRQFDLYSTRASTSAGIELLRNEILVLGNAAGWDPTFRIGHDVMEDALDAEALDRALERVPVRERSLGVEDIAALLVKAEPASSGKIRGQRHVMWDDSDIHPTRHARALVGGVLAGRLKETRLFVSGGAEHQGPDGGGPLAVIVRNLRGSAIKASQKAVPSKS
ncbi:ring-opening amidohydrolase [Hydrocarboniclastica marina]|uniref:Cyanuric acid amidohydrolase n=1 Tax=Hydrocarboniclastica marina TaxID=2259620 RepID=A0A4P7XKK1_9ALTE|nr:ring-opening amidohydrolase [Hydrocarboniclastica marina]MAM00114.1 cyanuric acid amidohydrolase [Alteromonadaceae bacterium]QCF27425.1 ring-opening amidohydrolase [Hydrocarboniclastica marina]|tara:strand:- start:4901 stop:6043 length:1143 start_codon:yes stop_codon:yes gene_type:complete